MLNGIFEKGKHLFKHLVQADPSTKHELLAEIEASLFQADVPPKTVDAILASLHTSPELALETALLNLFAACPKPLDEAALLRPHRLNTLCLTGINGGGKTTSIAKLVHRFQHLGAHVSVVGADTYRAAAQAQLQRWCQQLAVPFYGLERVQQATASRSQHPSYIATQGIELASKAMTNQEKPHIILVDTAGRLQVDTPLMQELAKLKRSLEHLCTQMPTLNIHTLLVLDATAGQNSLLQYTAFQQHMGVDALLFSKCDAQTRAGMILGLAHQHHTYPLYLAHGENKEALKHFIPEDFMAFFLGKAKH